MPARSPISGKLRPGIQDLPGAFLGGLQSAADVLNRAGIGITRKAQAASNTTPFERAQVGTPFIKGGVLGYKGADGQWYQRGDNDAGPESFFKPAIVTGLDSAGNVDRTQSDLYRQYAPKPFPMTPEGQFERYFKTPEMDQYFGAASRGQGAPKDVAGMESLASQLTAPQDVPLSAYYRAQSAAGRANMPEITQELGYAKGSALAEWATKNPMLAQRLYEKQKARKAMESPMAEFGARGSSPEGYAGTFREQPGLFGAVSNPVVPTENTDETGLTQGERVDRGRGVQDLKYWQMLKTQGYQPPFKADTQGLF